MKATQRLTEMERLAQLEKLKGHPRPELFSMLYTKHSDKTANGLTKAVIRWIEIHGGQAERINTMGRYIQGATVSKGFYGSQQLKGKYIPTTSTKGSADVSALVNGKTWKIEIKIGNDKQSEHQKKYQADIERAGGKYSIIRSLDEFVKEWEVMNDNL